MNHAVQLCWYVYKWQTNLPLRRLCFRLCRNLAYTNANARTSTGEYIEKGKPAADSTAIVVIIISFDDFFLIHRDWWRQIHFLVLLIGMKWREKIHDDSRSPLACSGKSVLAFNQHLCLRRIAPSSFASIVMLGRIRVAKTKRHNANVVFHA